MRNFFYRFFQGRYGSYGMDKLTRFLLILAVICLLLSICTPIGFLYYIAFALLILCYFRLFSKNITKRYEENERFVNGYQKITNFVTEHKNYHIYKCPECGQKIRIPRGKGMVMVTCPKCRTEFKKKS